jgi:hypothetical protein
MTALRDLPVSIVLPVMLGVYALAFLAGGIYYLEQQVARIRDLFPSRGPIAHLVGYTSLGIGFLAASAVTGYLLSASPAFYLAALLATASGVAFWVIRIHIDPTPGARIRDALLALICALLALLTAWWITTL